MFNNTNYPIPQVPHKPDANYINPDKQTVQDKPLAQEKQEASHREQTPRTK